MAEWPQLKFAFAVDGENHSDLDVSIRYLAYAKPFAPFIRGILVYAPGNIIYTRRSNLASILSDVY